MREDEQTSGISLHAGFPNPATDKSLGSLDLNQLLVQNTASTFFFRLRGHEWEGLGIFDNDIAIVNRSLDARQDDLVIWWDETTDGFAISRYKRTPQGATIWGVVTSTVHQFRRIDP